ncbi:MAG: hypothetical protein IJ088_06240 [Clostridia bacterium]|nr:hypothetical protein [Clostridia bacterium]
MEYRLFVSGNKICLTLRDYNGAFDPTEWNQADADHKDGEVSGICVVMAVAEDIHYFNAFNKYLIFWLDAERESRAHSKTCVFPRG